MCDPGGQGRDEVRETSDLSWCEHVESGSRIREPAWDQPRPSICVAIKRCVACSVFKAPRSKIRACP